MRGFKSLLVESQPAEKDPISRRQIRIISGHVRFRVMRVFYSINISLLSDVVPATGEMWSEPLSPTYINLSQLSVPSYIFQFLATTQQLLNCQASES